MAYGTPASRDEVAAYYTDIRRGRAPSEEQLAELLYRYDAIGGWSPLREITERQCGQLQRALDAAEPDRWTVALGMKHAPPFVEDGVAALAAAGVERIVGLVLAPHYARASVGQYAARAAAAGERLGVPVTTIESWHLEPDYVEFLATATAAALAALTDGGPSKLDGEPEVVFTAHSLPEAAVDAADPYPDQVRATAESVATLAGLGRWSTGWQSATRTGTPWLGPDILDVIRDRASEGCPAIVVCPCGFTSDHLEVLYDLDVVARDVAAECGIAFARTAMLNDNAAVLAALAARVRAAAADA